MCIACRKVCFSDVAARKLYFTRCVGVGVGLVLASQEEGRMAVRGGNSETEPVPTQPAGSSSDVFVLPPRPPNVAALMADVNDALRCVGVVSTTPPTPSPFVWLDPDALPFGEVGPRGFVLDNVEACGFLNNVDNDEDSGLSDLGDGPLAPPDEDNRSTHSNKSGSVHDSVSLDSILSLIHI